MLEGSILQKLYTAHQDTDQALNLGVYYKNTLVALCHALEDFILNTKSSPLVISAFQRGKWYLQEADRYGDIANHARKITIMASPGASFAEHSTSQRENVDLVSLNPDTDPVAQEWHLIICSPSYTAMVLCQELSEADYGKNGLPEHDLERKFYGFWTFEPHLVQETVEIAIAHINQYNESLATELNQHYQEISKEFGKVESEDTGVVVSKVVDYLQHSQSELLNQKAIADSEASYLPQSQALDDNLLSNEMQAFLRMAQLIDQADIDNPMAAAEVTALAETMGQVLDLPAWQQKRLRLASLLHRLVPALGQTPQDEDEDEEKAPSCDLIPGVEALRAMPRMSAIARIITHQTENWDGSGTPGELAHDSIPLESRILAIVSDFQRRVNDLRTKEKNSSREETLSQALSECQEQANTRFDPKLSEALGLLVMGMQQGMSLETSQPKISAGMWLLEDEQLTPNN